MHIGRQSVIDGKAVFNIELVEFSTKVMDELHEFRTRINSKLAVDPGNMHLYELQYDLGLLLEAVGRAIKALREGRFWRSNDPVKPLFIPIVELR